ncbi:hypothetical protein NST41_33895 [Paenibacillus sp. FSL L8-0696]|uniref:hypothetical protein n=1 Tax=Paenibacillus sp. FSL L8-0696 TaxID=2954524 RepID=UPI0031194503
MANKRLGDDRKDRVPSLRLPKWMIEQILEKGSFQKVVEEILSQHFKKENKSQK